MPIPLTNTFPAWAIVLLAGGVMERDGLFIVGGYVMMLGTTAWFFLLGAAVTETLGAVWHWMTG
jgi:hypothetical protein